MVESSDVSIVVDAQDCPPLPGLYVPQAVSTMLESFYPVQNVPWARLSCTPSLPSSVTVNKVIPI